MTLREETQIALTQEIRKDSARFTILGAVALVLGVVGFGYATMMTITSLFVFGAALVIGGVWHLVNAIMHRDEHGVLIDMPFGVLETVTGALLLSKPGASLLGLTLLTAGFLIIVGVIRMVLSAAYTLPGWGWSFASGIISAVLGILVWREWPVSSLWVLGAFVSAYLITSGAAFMALGIGARRAFPKPQPAA